ncbi:MAG: SGNH/GDSL hydrolase family protein [Ruminococcus sp.]|nr:SGNH/GDSL hydrolase family protein [Ruminococcus sp.]
MEQREKIEWLNYWIESANEREKKRILILGDSVARGYRPVLNRMVEQAGYVVDLLAMSYSIFDLSLINEIKHFIDSVGYQYCFIIFNLGSHHGYSLKIKENTDLQEAYYRKLDDILRLITKMSRKIITVSGTPERTSDKEAHNDEIQSRNSILKAISYKYKCNYVDLYSQMYNNKDFPLIDLFHFSDNGYEYIAYELSKALGIQIKNINANRISSPRTFAKILKKAKRIYIYGNGEKGKQLYKYLHFSDINVMARYVVSNEFYEKEDQHLILLDEIERELDIGDIILVTPEDISVWERLEGLNFHYYTLGKKVYSFIYEYIAVYIDL